MSDFECMPCRTRVVMQEAAETFRFYEREHRNKAAQMDPLGIITEERDGRLDKAERNKVMAEKIEVLLRD